jgi:DNA-binding transcriptional regulator YhcF (GntR family)
LSSASHIVVDPALELPPYQQVFEQIRGAIERGDLAAGSPLPTVRQLAGDLGIAPNTVARAYSELQAAGWLVGDGRRGTHVAGNVPRLDRQSRLLDLRETIERFVDTMRHRGFTTQEIAAEFSRVDQTKPF